MAAFDAGKAARRKVTEDSLVAALNRNTKKQGELEVSVLNAIGIQNEYLDKHLDAMTRLRDLQTSDLDRQLDAMRLAREEMMLGRHALNSNTEQLKRLIEILEAL